MNVEFLLGLITAIVTVSSGISTFLYRKRVEDVTRKRQTCAEGLNAVLEWLEVPYRIRRRSAEDGEVRQELAKTIHDLQVRINYHRAWLQVEAPIIAEKYEALSRAVKAATEPAIQQAWKQPRISKDSEMNIGSLGVFDIEQAQRDYVAAVRNEVRVWRFPWGT